MLMLCMQIRAQVTLIAMHVGTIQNVAGKLLRLRVPARASLYLSSSIYAIGVYYKCTWLHS